MPDIAENVQRVRERMARAAARVGRDPERIILIGASKSRSVQEIQAAMAAGLTHFGENYVQEARAKFEVLGQAVTWHLIGHLQTNKINAALPIFEWVHTIDSLRLAQALSQRATARGRTVRVLIEVHTGGEASKFGVEPEETVEVAQAIAALPGLQLAGLMTMPPWFEDPEQVRPFFRQVRHLAEEIAALGLIAGPEVVLSMGMSQDYEVAIEEGATMIRVGTALFGPRG
jgi:pyridoxal phosphate enzyme (YggS family)